MARREIFTLIELNQLIKSVIETALPETFLVTAEIASLDTRNHCYITLVEKDEETIAAEMKAIIWASRYKALSAGFRKATGIELSKGLKILFRASVSFHERYGLKFIITDIDPSYTIGEMAVKRKEILDRLVREGLKDKNKYLEFPLVPRRIGIISSHAAAGYEDLLSHLKDNPYGYKFTCTLYEAVMQGDSAEASIVSALNRCKHESSDLDVVVIVRGGGGKPDLHCFDSYGIGRAIALLGIPVISGIGHERDITVVDEVSGIRVKTPTAAADLIITRVKDFEDMTDSLAHNLVHSTHRLTSNLRETLSFLAKNLESSMKKELLNNKHRLDTFARGLTYSLKLVQAERERLRARQNNINHLNPRNVLKRGYSITYINGAPLKSVSEALVGDDLKTTLYRGELMSRITGKNQAGGRNE